MKAKSKPPTPDETAAVLSLRNALRIEWEDEAQKQRALEWYRVNEMRKQRARRSQYERDWVESKRAREQAEAG